MKLLEPCYSASWLLLKKDNVEKIVFGYVTGLQKNELEYVRLEELEDIERPFGLTIERDLYFVKKMVSEVK